MKLKSLNLINFRSYEEIKLDFQPGINVFIGNNGSGKTNILEAIYVLSLTKSNRISNDVGLIKNGFNNLIVSGEVIYDDYVKKYQVQIDKFGKKVYINNFQIKKISEYISNFCVTSFLPNDIEIIKGSPSIRRNVLNIQIGEIYNHYLKYVNEYNTLLKMRNEYLKRLSINSFADNKYLDIINEKIISISIKIYYFRFFYLDEINKIIPKIFFKLSGIKDLKIEYCNNLGISSYDETKIREVLLNKFKKNFTKELIQGMTLNGLHRDDFVFLINNQDASIYASQGQQRLIVIAYKIAELLIFKEQKGEYPVLLLDDVFSEIDIKKRNNIIKYLNNEMQVIITTTDLEDISLELVKCAKIFNIKNGEIKIKGGVKKCKKK